MAANIEWLRARGIGRERLAGHLGEFLTSNGYEVARTESEAPPETVVKAELKRTNPAVPPGARSLEFHLSPTSGGCAVAWVAPASIVDGDRARFDRLVRELIQQVERAVSTESHGTAKLSRAPASRMPWEAALSSGPLGSASPASTK
jgi:hypothetical protein